MDRAGPFVAGMGPIMALRGAKVFAVAIFDYE
jgi:hypothetical protein